MASVNCQRMVGPMGSAGAPWVPGETSADLLWKHDEASLNSGAESSAGTAESAIVDGMPAEKDSLSSKAGDHTKSPEQNVPDAIVDFLKRLRTGVVIPNAGPGLAAQSLLQSVSLYLYIGNVLSIGVDASGQGTVTFTNTWNEPAGHTSSYTANWPQPCFELAKAAYLNGKQIGVLSNGLPYGNNVQFVSM
jgi:hypothetical protein